MLDNKWTSSNSQQFSDSLSQKTNKLATYTVKEAAAFGTKRKSSAQFENQASDVCKA